MENIPLQEIQTALIQLLGEHRAKRLVRIIVLNKQISSTTYLTIREEIKKYSSPEAVKQYFGYIYYWYLYYKP